MDKYYVYIYLNPLKSGNYNYGKYHFDFEPFYVGQGNRLYQHLTTHNLKYTTIKVNIIKKILKENQKPIIIKLHENMLESDSFNKEMELIKLIGRRDLNEGSLANMTNGGDGSSGNIVSEETRNKMSESSKGEKNWNYDKTHSEETRKKMSDVLKGKIHTLEHRRKNSEANKGKTSGCKNPSAKKYKIIDPNGNEYIAYDTLKLFCKNNNLSIHTFRKYVDNGKIPKCRYSKHTTLYTIERDNSTNWEIIENNN